MDIIKNLKEMRKRASVFRAEDVRTALVPTMGALHKGHLSLLDIARKNADRTIMSIFVNAKQFNNATDLAKYPVNIERDLELAEKRGVDIVFLPSETDIYPSDFQTYVEVSELSKNLCGGSRPGHFKGVTTVVLKLFNIVMPDVAVFGEKDFQQLLVIERMVKDLDLPIEILRGRIVRESDGLAMSSRNQNLTPAERRDATSINRGLRLAEEAFMNGETSIANVISIIREEIMGTKTGKVDYIKVCNTKDLKDLQSFDGPFVIAVAAFFGNVRLIDNTSL